MAASYKTKKALKESVGQELRYVETSMFGNEMPSDGNVSGIAVVGPSPYERKWFAQVWTKNFVIVKVS
jgi:hypothetical protein